MARKTSTIKIGIFIFAGLAVLVAAIFLIGDKQSLFSSTFEVHAYFDDVQGLKKGAIVRLSGIDVGSVSAIEIFGRRRSRVRVSLDLIKDIKMYIRTDTYASVETEGLVGNKIVVLYNIGSSQGEQVKDGGTIASKEPMSIAAVIEETQGIMAYTKQMTKDLSEIVGRVNAGEGTIGKLLKDESLYNTATSITERADTSLAAITKQINDLSGLFAELTTGVQRVVTNVDTTIRNIDNLVVGIKSGKGVIGKLLVDGSDLDSAIVGTLKNVRQTSTDARLAASRLAENMEALKHNWLFKSYFENRGYWDKAEHEDSIDNKLKELDEKIKQLDGRIETLKSLEKETSRK